MALTRIPAGGVVTATTFTFNSLNVTATTVTASTITGALVITGGLGIGGSGYIGGNLTVLGTINATITGIATSATNLAGGTIGQVPYQSGIGATSFYGPGTAGQILLSNGASAPVYTNTASVYVGAATGAVNLFGGTPGQLHYQTAAGTSAFLSTGTTGQLLVSAAGAPVWTNTSSLYVQDANVSTNLRAGTAGQLHYQTGPNASGFINTATTGNFLQANFTGAPTWTTTASMYVGAATSAVNLFGGSAGQFAYQTGAGATSFVSTGSMYVSRAVFADSASGSAGSVANALTIGTGLSGTVGTYNGSAAVTISLNTATLMATAVLAQTATTATNAGTAYATIGTHSTGTGILGSSFNGSANQTWTLDTSTLMARAVQTVQSLSTGTGIFGGTFNGSTAQTWTLNTATLMQVATQVVQSLSTGTGILGNAYNGSTAQTWTLNTATLMANAVTAINLAGGSAGQFAYQTGAGATSFVSTGSMYVSRAVLADSVTGSAGSLVNAVTFNNAGTGDASGTSYNGGAARTVSYNTLGAMPTTGGTFSGPVTFSQPVTFSGSATYVLSTNTFYTDNILEMHTPPAGVSSPWFLDDGKDIGFRFHYYTNSTDTNAALVLDNASKELHWYSSGAESLAGDFSTGTYGIFRTGAIRLVTGTQNQANTSTGDLTVLGGVGVGGSMFVGGIVTATTFAGALRFSHSAGTGLTGSAYNGSAAQTWSLNTATLMASAVSAINLSAGSAMALPYQSASGTTAYLAAGTAGQILQTNSTGSAPTWVNISGLSAGTATNADNLRTVIQTASGTYYPSFVDSNNGTAAYEAHYTTSSFSINPANGNVSIGGILTATNIQVGTGVLIYTSGNQLLTPIPSSSIRTNTGSGNIVINGGGGTGNAVYFGFDQPISGGTYFAQNGATLAYVSTTSGIIINNGITAYSGAQLSVNGGAYVNGTLTATNFVGSFSGAVTGASTQLNTQLITASGTYYPTFVDSNNASATAELHYTTSSFSINPATGVVGINGVGGTALNITVPSTVVDRYFINATAAVNSFSIYDNSNTPYINSYAGMTFRANQIGGTGGTINFSGGNVYVATNLGVGTNSPVATVDVRGGLAVSGWSNNNGGTAGGLEIGWDGGQGLIQSYNRVGSVYTAVTLNGSINKFLTSGTERLRITANGGISFGATGTAYGSSGQVLQSNGDAPPTWINASSITAGSASLTSTYVGFGSGSNTLTGSTNLTWNDSTQVLAVAGRADIQYLKISVPNSYTASNPATSGSVSAGVIGTITGASYNQEIDFGIGSGAAFWLQNTNKTAYNVNYPIAFNPNGGNVGIGTIGPRGKLEVVNGSALVDDDPAGYAASFVGPTGANQYATVSIASNDAVAAGTGGNLSFGGRYNSANQNFANWASIKGLKTNATSGDYGGYLSFYTRLTGAGSLERLRITGNGGFSFGASGTAYGSSGQILQSNGDAPPTWVNASGITSGATSLTSTYVGFGSGSNLLTGSSSLTWNGTTLYVNGRIQNPGYKTYNVTTVGQGNVNSTYELMRIGRDSANWSTNIGYEVTVRSAYFNSGGATKWYITYGYGDTGTISCMDARGGTKHRVYLGAEVTVTGNIKYIPVYVDIPNYFQVAIEVKYNTTEVTTFNSSGQVYFTGTMAVGTGSLYGGDTHLVPNGGNVGVGTTSPTVSSGLGIHINNAGGTHANLKLQSTSRTWELLGTSGGYFSLYDTTGGADRFSVTAAGGIAFGGASNYGSSGQILQSNGNAAPTWVNASGLSAGSTTASLTMNNGGAGDASGTTFNGGTARTISYNTVGAPSTTGANASGTWGINISGNLTSSAPQLAAATESNSVYITAPSYTTDTPVKLLNFDWYGNVFSMGNIRSGATPSSGFGFYYTASGGSRTELARFTTAGALSFGTSGTAYGTSGQLLQSNGNAAPTWVNASGLTAGTANSLLNFTAATSGNPLDASSPTTLDAVGYVNSNIPTSYGLGGSVGSNSDGGLYVAGYSTSWYHEIYGDFRTGGIAVRGKYSGTWQSWRNIPCISVQDTAPSIYNPGDLWWESDTGRLKVLYYDGSSSQWVDAVPVINTSLFFSKSGGAISGPVSINGALSVTGNITATAEITAYYSDRRLKTDVLTIENALVKVKKLNGVTYRPNELAESYGLGTNSDVVGLFADEVEQVLPQAVKPAPFDIDENGNSKSGENYKTIQYEKVVPLLVEAIKEQQSIIEAQQAKIDRLMKHLGLED